MHDKMKIGFFSHFCSLRFTFFFGGGGNKQSHKTEYVYQYVHVAITEWIYVFYTYLKAFRAVEKMSYTVVGCFFSRLFLFLLFLSDISFLMDISCNFINLYVMLIVIGKRFSRHLA